MKQLTNEFRLDSVPLGCAKKHPSHPCEGLNTLNRQHPDKRAIIAAGDTFAKTQNCLTDSQHKYRRIKEIALAPPLLKTYIIRPKLYAKIMP
ncbi:MAG: hypothetical protein ABSF37_00375 [Sedimentisphaerales bacterium]|jgi:hypothetical protein